MEGIGVGFRGMGAFLPEDVRANDFWSDEWRAACEARLATDITGAVDKALQDRLSDVDPEVAKHAMRFRMDPFRGTKERRVMNPDMRPSDLEVAACRAALEDADLEPSDIDCICGQSLISDWSIQPNHGAVARKLGLSHHTTSFSVEAGCSSFLPQLMTAVRLVQTGEFENVLIYVGNSVSLLTDYDTPSSVLAGDGACAAVIGRVEEGLGYVAQAGQTHGEYHEGVLCVPRSTPHTPHWRTDLMDERLTIQNVDLVATHDMGAHAAALCRAACERVLARAGCTAADVDFFVCAQSTAWFSQAFCEALGIDGDKCVRVDEHFERFAHLLSASAPLNWLIARETGRLKRGDLVLAYSPGVGFTQYATLYRWNEPGTVGSSGL